MCAAATLLAGCGGGGSDDEPPFVSTTHKNCRYEFVQGGSGLGPSKYALKCHLVPDAGGCDMTEPCTVVINSIFPSCVPGSTSCTLCPQVSISTC